MMKRIALTGGIACGKSALALFLKELGCDVLDADDVVHALEAPGGAAVAPIAEAFGEAVCAVDGGIDRQRLGARIFSDGDARQRLNAIVHPLVRAAVDAWLYAPGAAPKVVVIPLLFEVGWEQGWDAVVCVACHAGTQLRRLTERGLSAADAQARLAAQMPLREKTRRAGYVVWNDGDWSELRHAAEQLARQFFGEAET